MSRRAIALALLAATATACDPGYGIRGNVHEPGDCREGAEMPSPVPTAKLEVTCPGVPGTILEAVSAADGSFGASRLGSMPLDCTVRVTKEGFQTRTYAVGDLCGWYHESLGSCMALSLEVLLSRTAAASPPSASTAASGAPAAPAASGSAAPSAPVP